MTGLEIAFGVAAVVGSAVSAMGAMQQSASAAAAANYNAEVEQNRATQARWIADREAQKIKAAENRAAGTLIATVGASGGTLEGSPLEVLADNAANFELDRLTAIYSGEIQAEAATQRSILDRLRAQSIERSAPFAAGGKLLSGAGRVGTLLGPNFGFGGGGGNSPTFGFGGSGTGF